MINSFSVSNFKLHKNEYQMDFENLNILTGENHSGKSSLLQAIRLLNIWVKNPMGFSHLPIEYVDTTLKPQDILNKDVSRTENIRFDFTLGGDSILRSMRVVVEFKSSIEIGINILGQSLLLLYKLSIYINDICYDIVLDEKNINSAVLYNVVYRDYQSGKEEICDFQMNMQGVLGNIVGKFPIGERENELLGLLSDLNSWFHTHTIAYLSGIRTGEPQVNIGSGLPFQLNGCNSAELLEGNKYQTCFDGEHSVQEAFEYWTSHILGYDIIIRYDNNQYYFMVNEDGVAFRLNQSGLGISQILPIISMVLLSEKNDLLIIENPEVHLHPKWKTRLMELFYYAAEHGVQIILETQGIEIVNRARVKCKENEKNRENTKMWFFEKQKFECDITEIGIKEDGGLDYWPKDFLDQVTLEDSYTLL